MKAIYASKIYKSSRRKANIVAAMQNPSNSKLLIQLGSYLDEEYRTSKNLGIEEPEAENVDADIPEELNPGLDDDFNPSEHLVDFPSGPKPSAGKADVNPSFDNDEMPGGPKPDDEAIVDDVTPEEHEADDNIEDVEESTKVPQEPVTACRDVDTSVIKGSLNGREDTSGVLRVMKKESELWIYYNDTINLNNIMSNVIEYLNASGETYLEFNRLARSDNAMVFQINESAKDIEPINKEES